MPNFWHTTWLLERLNRLLLRVGVMDDDVAGLYEKWVVVMTKSNTFGVQIRPQETITAVVEHVLKTAHAEGLKFVRMDYLDSISVGSTQFGRFRVDDYIGDLVLKLHASGRAVIMANEGGYQVRITDRKGPVPNTTMHAIPRSPSQFRGPGAQHWTRQFESKV